MSLPRTIASLFQGEVQHLLRRSGATKKLRIKQLRLILEDKKKVALHPAAAFSLFCQMNDQFEEAYLPSLVEFFKSMPSPVLTRHSMRLQKQVQEAPDTWRPMLVGVFVERAFAVTDMLLEQRLLPLFLTHMRSHPTVLLENLCQRLEDWETRGFLLSTVTHSLMNAVQVWVGETVPEEIDLLILKLLTQNAQWFRADSRNASLRAVWEKLPEARQLALLRKINKMPPCDLLSPTPGIVDWVVEHIAAQRVTKPKEEEAKLLLGWGDEAFVRVHEHLCEGTHPGDVTLLSLLVPYATRELLPLMSKRLHDKRKSCRAQVIEAFARLGPDLSMESLTEAANSASGPTRRDIAALLLRWYPHPEVEILAHRMLAEDESLDDILGVLEDTRLDMVAEAERCLQLRISQHTIFSGNMAIALERHLEAFYPVHNSTVVGLGWPILPSLWAWGQRQKKWTNFTQTNWFTLLSSIGVHPETRAAAVLMLCQPMSGNKTYVQELARRFPDSEALLLALWMTRRVPQRAVLYAWLTQQRGIPLEAHLRALEDTSIKVRGLAVEYLATSLDSYEEEDMAHLEALLKEGREPTVRSVARLLGLVGGDLASRFLVEAQQGKRSPKVLESLQHAQQRAQGMEVQDSMGTYPLGESADLRSLLEELRLLAHGKPSKADWVRLCNLLERLEHMGQLQIGLDYLGEEFSQRWPVNLRPLPFYWKERPSFQALSAPQEKTLRWLTVERALSPHHQDSLQGVLNSVQKRARMRRVSAEQVREWVRRWLPRAWAFCETHQLPPEGLHLRFDGGAHTTASIPSTVIDLWHGFGLSVARQSTTASLTEDTSAGLRYARLHIPARHPARITFHHVLQGSRLDLLAIWDMS